MIRISYTATRALNGHSIGDTVTLTFSAVEPMTPGFRMVRDVQKSLGNKRETLLHNAYRTWNVTTQPMQNAALDAVEEFLQAVADGSSFEFEPYWIEGAEPADVNTETRLRSATTASCTLGGDSYDLTLLLGNGNGGADDWYQVSFTAEEIA